MWVQKAPLKITESGTSSHYVPRKMMQWEIHSIIHEGALS